MKPTKKVQAAATGGTLAAAIVAAASLLGLNIPLEIAGYIEAGVLAAVGSAYQKAEA